MLAVPNEHTKDSQEPNKENGVSSLKTAGHIKIESFLNLVLFFVLHNLATNQHVPNLLPTMRQAKVPSNYCLLRGALQFSYLTFLTSSMEWNFFLPRYTEMVQKETKMLKVNFIFNFILLQEERNTL